MLHLRCIEGISPILAETWGPFTIIQLHVVVGAAGALLGVHHHEDHVHNVADVTGVKCPGTTDITENVTGDSCWQSKLLSYFAIIYRIVMFITSTNWRMTDWYTFPIWREQVPYSRDDWGKEGKKQWHNPLEKLTPRKQAWWWMGREGWCTHSWGVGQDLVLVFFLIVFFLL